MFTQACWVTCIHVSSGSFATSTEKLKMSSEITKSAFSTPLTLYFSTKFFLKTLPFYS